MYCTVQLQQLNDLAPNDLDTVSLIDDSLDVKSFVTAKRVYVVVCS